MPCEHRGDLVLPLPVFRPGERVERGPPVELTVCDLCGALFVPPEKVPLLKARESERLLRGYHDRASAPRTPYSFPTTSDRNTGSWRREWEKLTK